MVHIRRVIDLVNLDEEFLLNIAILNILGLDHGPMNIWYDFEEDRLKILVCKTQSWPSSGL